MNIYKHSNIIKLLFAIMIYILLSCNSNTQIKFDKGKWNEENDPAFPSPYRSKMLIDLTTNYKLVGLKYFQLVDLLGLPDFKDTSSLSYSIIEDYGYDIDPVYTKYLDFTFSKDSLITSFKIREWKK